MIKCFYRIPTFVLPRVLLVCVASSFGVAVLSGCPAASSSSKMSKQEEANFRGGPMPADFKPNVGQGPPKTAAPK